MVVKSSDIIMHIISHVLLFRGVFNVFSEKPFRAMHVCFHCKTNGLSHQWDNFLDYWGVGIMSHWNNGMAPW